MTERLQFFATAPRGLEPCLQRELRGFGIESLQRTAGGVGFSGTLEHGYRACLWSRCASRVILELAAVPARDPDELYRSVRALSWEQHLGVGDTLAVRLVSVKGAIGHSHYGALKVKDAIVDRFRELQGSRPSVDTRDPDLRVHVYVERAEARIGIDLGGEGLHRRGYRRSGATAPLKETLAAGLLLLMDWPEAATQGKPLLDPMCGSGTVVIEAALMAGDVAPALLTRKPRCTRWRGHDAPLWARLWREAESRRQAGLAAMPEIVGLDSDPRALQVAKEQVQAAGMQDFVRVEQRDLSQLRMGSEHGPGLIVANPPYGKRLGGDAEARGALQALESALLLEHPGWQFGILGTHKQMQASSLPATRRQKLFNGKIACQFAMGTVPEQTIDPAISEELRGFENRVQKNLRKLRKWIEREAVSCYRVYDADLPQFALAIDRYGDHVHVQEYVPPSSVDPGRARTRATAVIRLVPELLGVAATNVVFKQRRRQSGASQYGKMGRSEAYFVVKEGGLSFWINLHDRLDTGLFLDHRPTRKMLGEAARGGRFLNLFCYTATATVYAAAGGARSTTSVDMSRTYLEWARWNLELNGLRGRNELIRADCLQWVEQAIKRGHRYDLVFLDPPTFSNSKGMQQSFDVQRDHGWLIQRVGRLLAPHGTLVFSTNRAKFELDPRLTRTFRIEDLTRATTPLDFTLGPRREPHRCWRFRPNSP